MKIVLVVALMVLGGCAYLEPVQERVQKAVDVYCTEPEVERELIRASINPTPGGNTVRVECAGDVTE